jgi:hypothetical protein
MAGLPWLIVFMAIAWIGMKRSWFWLTMLSIFCMGQAATDTNLGSTIYQGYTGFLAWCWLAIVHLANAVAGG